MNAEATPVSAREPDQLLVTINQSIFTKAMLVSVVAHLLFIALTSFALYRDWAEYGIRSDNLGFHTPSDIKSIKRERVKQQEQAERDAKLQARLQEQRAAATLEAEKKEASPPAAGSPATAPTAVPEVEPLPPKQSFSLDDLPALGL